MSYALHLVTSASVDLRALDVVIGEEALDQLERLDPSSLRVDAYDEAVFDFERRVGDLRHVVFVLLHVDHANRRLTVLTIADHITAIDESQQTGGTS